MSSWYYRYPDTSYQIGFINYFKEKGFPENHIKYAMEKTNFDLQATYKMLTIMRDQEKEEKELQIALQRSKEEVTSRTMQNADDELNRALEMSKHESGDPFNLSQIPSNPENMLRDKVKNMPSGIINIGNTCYFNSLLQIYYRLPFFVENVMSFEDPGLEKNQLIKKDSKVQKNINMDGKSFNSQKGEKDSKVEPISDKKDKRKLASIKLVNSLQIFFSQMILSDRMFLDPTNVLNSIVDDKGNQIPIGDQKDVGEFNINFITRISEGLIYSKNRKSSPKMEEQKKLESGENIDYNKCFTKMLDDPTNTELQLISKMTCKSLSYIQGKENNGEDFKNENEGTLSQIALHPSKRNFYDALESLFNGIVENYKTLKGSMITAKEQIWITSLSPVLFFQIQRVSYNIQSKSLEKDNSEFKFEKSIFLDRYLINNKEFATPLRNNATILREKLSALESAMSKFKFYHEKKNVHLLEILSSCENFFTSQKIDYNGTINENTLVEPHQIGNLGLNPEDIQTTINVIKSYEGNIKAKIDSMEEQEKKIKAELKNNYTKLRNVEYFLHSIMVHEGSAEYGHYFCLTYDFDYNRWLKISDRVSSEIKEEEVFRLSEGDNRNKCAYLLVYVAKDILPKYFYNTSNNEKKLTPMVGFYKGLLKSSTAKEIEEDNKKLEKEIEDYRVQNYIIEIQNAYDYRYKLAEEAIKNEKYSYYKPFNFLCQILIKNKINLFKWCLLNECIIHVCGEENSLYSLKEGNQLVKLLREKFLKNVKNSPQSLTLNESDMIDLCNLKEDYENLITGIIININIIDKMIKRDLISTIKCLSYSLNLQTEDKAIKKVREEVNNLLILIMASEVNRKVMDKEFQNAEDLFKIVASFAIEFMKKNDPFVQHFCKIIYNLIQKFKEKNQRELTIKKWELYFSSLQNKIPLEKDKLPNPIPSDLEQIISSIKKDSSIYGFINGWESGIFYDYYQKRQQLFKQYATWKEWHRIISDNKEIPFNKLIEDEKNEGIDFTKGFA